MFLIKPVYAQCPVCVVTVGGGLLIAKKLGIDDLLISIWLSALNTVIAFWLVTKIKKRPWNNGYLWTAGFFLLTVVYLTITKQIGHINNTFLRIDKVLFGLVVGLVISIGAILFDEFLRVKNNGKVLFSYQKIIIPVVLLTITTIIFKSLL